MANEIIGTIFSKEEADTNFGDVLYSTEISTSELLNLCSKAEKLLMFSLKEEKLSILKEGRIPLYPAGFNVDPIEKYVVYSKSIVEELLNTGKADVTIIEQRNDIISASNGQQTLEAGSWCPPFCS